MNYKVDYKDDYSNRPHYPKKVKHVHFIMQKTLANLENDVNNFADNNPGKKILGIKLSSISSDSKNVFIATITYLCDAPGEFDRYDDYSDEEED